MLRWSIVVFLFSWWSGCLFCCQGMPLPDIFAPPLASDFLQAKPQGRTPEEQSIVEKSLNSTLASVSDGGKTLKLEESLKPSLETPSWPGLDRIGLQMATVQAPTDISTDAIKGEPQTSSYNKNHFIIHIAMNNICSNLQPVLQNRNRRPNRYLEVGVQRQNRNWRYCASRYPEVGGLTVGTMKAANNLLGKRSPKLRLNQRYDWQQQI